MEPETTSVLSYASFDDEFDTWELNSLLAAKKKLHLPKADGIELRFFQIADLERQLKANTWGIYEPIPELCEPTNLSSISMILVPALAFDRHCHRLGYGKGYYDSFLAGLPLGINTYGLGFLEQLSLDFLPASPADIPVKNLLLF